MPTINAANFQSAVMDLLNTYGDEVIDANETAVKTVAKDVTKELKKAGTFGGSGQYRKSLTYQLTKTRISVEASIGSKKLSGLTHLLEFGHAKQNGGRTRAFNFVAPINDTVESKYMKEMEELLQ